MLSVKEILEEASALSTEDRLAVVDSLLNSLHPIDPAHNAAWAEEAQRRLEAFRSGKVQAIPGEQVFTEIKQRFHSA